jgi:GNAT superfamily N-acetyltransferase
VARAPITDVVPAAAEHADAVAATLAAAFLDDPVQRWLFPDARRRRARLRRFFALEARHVALPHGASWHVAGERGAALLLPPGHWRLPLRLQALHGPGYARAFGTALPRALGVLAAMERRHPREPHWYVAFVGVVPAAQRQGLGAALLRPLLERCDRERLPAYLEASSPGSARLYERLGFRGDEHITPFGSPPIRLMTRAPQAPG